MEGESIPFACTNPGTMQPDVVVLLDGQIAPNDLLTVTAITNGGSYTFGPVTRSHDRGRLRCDFFLLPMGSRFTAEIVIDIIC